MARWIVKITRTQGTTQNDMSVRATVTENMEDLSRSIMKNLYFKREVVIL